MFNMRSKKAIIVATVLALGAGTAAFAKGRGNDAVSELAQAKITLAQAITAAEQHVGGQATKAELERHKGKTAFEVEVVKGSAVSKVVVDATDGKVLATAADREDHDGEQDDD
jgi:uncharacterized membrane protein YkoI